MPIKNTLITLSLLLGAGFAHAQKPCEYSSDVKDSLGTYKATKDVMLHEKVFGGKQLMFYVSLAKTDQTVMLEVTQIQKSTGFLPAYCFDKTSRIVLQLLSNKIVTLPFAGTELCGTLIKGQNDSSNRVLTGKFLIPKEAYAELMKSPLSFIRVKYATETVDYPMRSNLVSETDKKTYSPESLFIDYLNCVKP
ncbi:MAG: hypothetical protein CFE24_04560 [Flavobacterium sp. BFFFF2]|nr:MAG: hypothetical protein CFE24_04560 [Flavobacterium sp. BFFFF2]